MVNGWSAGEEVTMIHLHNIQEPEKVEPETAEPKPEKEKVTQVAKPAVEANAADRRKSPEKVPDLTTDLTVANGPDQNPIKTKKGKGGEIGPNLPLKWIRS